jgi:hypothetical protein
MTLYFPLLSFYLGSPGLNSGQYYALTPGAFTIPAFENNPSDETHRLDTIRYA